MTKKVCRDCPNEVVNTRRNLCPLCRAKAQRESWAVNRESRLRVSRANYAKHAEKRRAEASAYKSNNREYYSLAEWFRRKGIPISHLDPSDITALVEMKKALKSAKAQTL
jgi:NMD protein affecting ribosome stability and mRNA decay